MLEFSEEKVNIDGGGYMIPAIMTLPTDRSRKYPAVIMLHGTASNKNEVGNGFQKMAEKLSRDGFIAIRFDFIGNGESNQDYIRYTIQTAAKETEIILRYCLSLSFVDNEHIGLLGWSEGGTIALLVAGNRKGIASVITWSGSLKLYKEERDQQHYDLALKNGYYQQNFEWREPTRISIAWFEQARQLDMIKIIGNITVPILSIAGSNDVVVNNEDSRTIQKTSMNQQSECRIIDQADHIFNILTDDPSAFENVMERSVRWLNKICNEPVHG